MTRPELLEFYPAKMGTLTLMGAGSYAVPTLAWLQGPFWDFFRAELWDRDLSNWKVRWTCRDFARRYASLAQECWAATAGGTTDDGVAVGELWFTPHNSPPGIGHAICPAVTDQGRVYIDPQSNLKCTLSPEEYESRYFLRF